MARKCVPGQNYLIYYVHNENVKKNVNLGALEFIILLHDIMQT